MLVYFVEILKGGVKFGNNQLCNVETIQWYDIVNAESKPNMELPMASSNPLCKQYTFYSIRERIKKTFKGCDLNSFAIICLCR